MTATFYLRGDIEGADAATLRAELAAFLAASPDADDLVVDCTHLGFIDSHGIAVILDGVFDLERVGCRVRTTHLSAHLAGLLRIAQLDDDRVQALRAPVLGGDQRFR